ncbi:hypothetical protein J6590_022882 [Homalodisca vitripennis]|nr:hypothetical protein J6590_022882 [Homalodisca vitripennis]
MRLVNTLLSSVLLFVYIMPLDATCRAGKLDDAPQPAFPSPPLPTETSCNRTAYLIRLLHRSWRQFPKRQLPPGYPRIVQGFDNRRVKLCSAVVAVRCSTVASALQQSAVTGAVNGQWSMLSTGVVGTADMWIATPARHTQRRARFRPVSTGYWNEKINLYLIVCGTAVNFCCRTTDMWIATPAQHTQRRARFRPVSIGY